MGKVTTKGVCVALTLAAVLAGACWLRFADIGAKPLHADESEQAFTLSRLVEGGGYRYDPREHHGPVLYYAAAAVMRLAGRNEFAAFTAETLRLTPAVFGVLLTLSFLLWWRRKDPASGAFGVGIALLLVAAGFAATSPVAVYYSRYFIQETPFVACFWLAVPLLWRACSNAVRRDLRGGGVLPPAVAGGVFFGLALALKETWVLMVAAGAAGGAAVAADEFLTRRRNARPFVKPAVGALRRMAKPAAVAAAAAAVTAVAFLSSFGANWQGVADSVLTYFGYAGKAAGGAGHDHPFGWYWDILFGSSVGAGRGSLFAPREIFALAGAALALALCALPKPGALSRQARRLAVFCVVCAATLFLLYSLIPYKTPWLMLGVLPPLWLAAGIGYGGLLRWFVLMARDEVAAVFRSARNPRGPASPSGWRLSAQLAAIALTAAGVAALLILQWKSASLLSRRFGSDERNPLAYVHTSDSVLNVARRVAQFDAAERELAAAGGGVSPLLVRSYSAEYWPLPWELRRWWRDGDPRTRVGFWRSPELDPSPALDAPVVITGSECDAAVRARLRGQYVCDPYALRPGVLINVYLRADLLRIVNGEAKREHRR
ncbi:MAG: TIGR03663 family protein [Puniceicoccales bacterium]|jgi:uncharacterized protein (TIGR03663 family)|nr:TIGR03663 family protein [Puniceicoccales bacterium]